MATKIPLTAKEALTYASLICDLHILIEKEKGDTEEADNLRDKMDQYWWRASEEEEAIAGDISAKLYTLQ